MPLGPRPGRGGGEVRRISARRGPRSGPVVGGKADVRRSTLKKLEAPEDRLVFGGLVSATMGDIVGETSDRDEKGSWMRLAGLAATYSPAS